MSIDPSTIVPTVTGISPTSGPTAGGTNVVLTGTGFTEATAVKFGTISASNLIVDSDTQITVTGPTGANSSDPVDVIVVTPGGTSALSQFTYLAREDLFYQHDPLLRLLKDWLKLDSFKFILGISVLSIGQFVVARALTGIHITPKIFLIAILDVFTNVLFFWIYCQLPTRIVKLFNKLVVNQILLVNSPRKTPIESQRESYQVFLKQFSVWMNSYAWLILILPCIIAYPDYRLVGLPNILLNPEPFWYRSLSELVDLFVGYAVVLSIIRILVTLFFLYRSFDWFNIQIKPLHPDGAGGLGILSEVMWYCAGIILGISLSFYEDSLLSSQVVNMILLVIAYVFLIPPLFLSWLFIPHHAMRRFRDETVLQPLTEEFNRVLSKMVPVANEETPQMADGTERLKELTKRNEFWRDTLPVWPLEVAQMRQL